MAARSINVSQSDANYNLHFHDILPDGLPVTLVKALLACTDGWIKANGIGQMILQEPRGIGHERCIAQGRAKDVKSDGKDGSKNSS